MNAVGNIYEVGLWELQEYADSAFILPRLKAEKEEVIESLYDDCVPSTVQLNELDQLVHVAINTEDKALEIIEHKELYDKKIQRHSQKAQLFEQAMDSLTDRERDVIQVYYFHRINDLGLSIGYFLELLESAQAKLCNSIELLQQSKFQLMKLQEHKEKLKRISEFKQAN